MKKLKLLLAVFALFGVSTAWAQTDVTSTYMTDPSFENNNNTTSDISGTGVIGSSDWNVTSLSYARVALFNSNSTISTFGGTTSVSNGSYYLMIRSNLDQGKTQNIRQNSDMALPKGRYSISFDYKAARVKDVSRKFVISAINSGGSTTYGSKSIEIPKISASDSYFSGIDWTTASFEFTHESTTNTRINISCETQGTANSSSSQHTVVLLDNFVINYYNINGDVLAALIAQATSINTAKGGLTDAISAAQDVYDGIDDTPDYQDDIDDAITALKSAITTKVAGITMKHNDDLSYLIANAGFEGITAEMENYSTVEGKDYSIYGWILNTTCDSGQGAVLTYNSGLTVNSATIPASDNESNTGKALGISVGWAGTQLYKTAPITLPAGKYNLKVYSYNAGTSTTLTSKFGFAPTSSAAMLSTKTSYTKDEWGNEEVTIELASATEGCFQLGGVAASGGSGNTAKVFFDNITLTYINELAEAQEQWQVVHDALADLNATLLPDAAEEVITNALSLSVPTSTVEAVNEAKAALQALIDSYDGIKAAYDKVNALITLATNEKNNSAGDADAKSTLATAISTAATNIETRTTATSLIDTDYATLETARQTYVTSGAEPADGHPFECTFKISNPGFEQDGKETTTPAGWTIPNKGATYGAKAKGSMTGAEGNYIFNNWQSWWMDCDVQQVVTSLPNGRYEVTAVMASNSGTSMLLRANGTYKYQNASGENNGILVSASGDVLDGNLTIYAQAGRRDDASLLRADDFTLSFVGLKPVLNDLIASATEMLTPNVGSGVFQIPSSAASTLSGAIAAAQTVYDDDDAYGDDIQDAIDALNTDITTFQGTELNEPASGVRYKLALDGRGTLTFQTASTEGGYGMPFTDAADYKAQAFALTKVSGNNYNMSFTDLDGNTRYICTRAAYGEGGTGTAGIRTTTESEKALAVTIKATTTDGVYNLLNTARDNAKLGSNGGDFYTDDTYTSWSFVEASQVSVPVTIAADVKFATRIFPFKPTLPSGVIAYSCAETSGTTLTLVEEATPAANTPYILYAENGIASPDLTGWGTASAETYTTGLLTGVFTSKTAPNNSYVLAKIDDKVLFYQVDNDDKPTVTANRCYLTAPAGARVLNFPDNVETGIDAINALTSSEAEIYNAAGARVPALQKGLNIIKMHNGSTRKVIVK